MGHLDNNQRIIEARLTSLGRKKLAEGDGLDITQFALSDDEVDYDLWQDGLPKQDAGAIIENLPTYEAFNDESQALRYKILSLEQQSDTVPVISVPANQKVINLDEDNEFKANPVVIAPETNIRGDKTSLDKTLGYTAILQNELYANLKLESSGQISKTEATIPALYGKEEGIDDPNATHKVGTKFVLGWDGASLDSDKKTTLSIIGNETGLSVDLEVNVISTS